MARNYEIAHADELANAYYKGDHGSAAQLLARSDHYLTTLTPLIKAFAVKKGITFAQAMTDFSVRCPQLYAAAVAEDRDVPRGKMNQQVPALS